MRLTLRTLLGWIDGVLPPGEQRLIGDLVAGSKLATRLAERIREGESSGTTDVPSPGGRVIADDPNSVAEFIDNTLSSEHLPTFERVCIESRPHLAEVAACHGMLADIQRDPSLVRMPREQRSVLGQRILVSLHAPAPAVAASPVLPAPVAGGPRAEDSEDVSRNAVTAEKPGVAAQRRCDARAAADASVQAMLTQQSAGPVEPVRMRVGWHQAPVAPLVSTLPLWLRPAAAVAGETPAGDSAVSASPSGPAVAEPAVTPPGPAGIPAGATGTRRAGSFPAWTAWLTAALGLAVLLAAGGALTGPLRGSKTYQPEPGCMHCTKP